jgi:hypothetical protein
MRVTALLAVLALASGCSHQNLSRSIPEQEWRVVADENCEPYSPNYSIVLERDFEARLTRPLGPMEFPKPRCWYVTPSGGLLLHTGQRPASLSHESPECPLVRSAERKDIPQEHIESSDTDAPSGATVDLRGIEHTPGVSIAVCYRNGGSGWEVERVMVSMSR